MDLWFVHDEGVERHEQAELTMLLAREDGFVWVDVPTWDEQAEDLLTHVVGAHPLVVADCRQRNHVPTVHGYSDHVRRPPRAVRGHAGHVHLLELDQLVGRRYLVTVHGPINPVVDIREALRETDAVRNRIENGKLRPGSPADLSHGSARRSCGRSAS